MLEEIEIYQNVFKKKLTNYADGEECDIKVIKK